MQGIGVSTPRAAAVAAATVGLAIDVHIPKGMILTIGIWSMIFASGTMLVITLLVGNTTSELGATPKLHCIIAPIQTCRGKIRLLHRGFEMYNRVYAGSAGDRSQAARGRELAVSSVDDV
jgi:hypothetical protein